MSTEAETKTCPDCAEQVLAAARKCRFCGYRFDEPARKKRSGGPGGLMDLLRTPDPDIHSVPDLLHAWDIRLRPDEIVPDEGGLSFARVDDAMGYIVVTSSRFRFLVIERGAKTLPSLRIDRYLGDLREAKLARRRLRQVVVLRWDDGENVVRLELADQSQLVELLTPDQATAR